MVFSTKYNCEVVPHVKINNNKRSYNEFIR